MMSRNTLHTIPEMDTSLDEGLCSGESERSENNSDENYSEYSSATDSLLLGSSDYDYDCTHWSFHQSSPSIRLQFL